MFATYKKMCPFQPSVVSIETYVLTLQNIIHKAKYYGMCEVIE